MEPFQLDDAPEDVRGSRGLDLQSLEKTVLMQKVLAQMKDEDVDVLFDRYVTLMDLKDMAAERGISKQALAFRLRTAKANFLVAFADKWDE